MSIVGNAAPAEAQSQVQETQNEGVNDDAAEGDGEGEGQSTGAGTPQAGGKEKDTTPPFFVPEAFKGDPALKSVKDWEGLFKTFVNGQRMLGKSYRLPSETDDPKTRAEKLSEMYKAIGRPDGPDGYELEEMPKLPNGIEWAPESINEFKQAAYELGLPPTGAKKLIDLYAKNLNDLIPDPDKEAAEVEEKLRGEWGDVLYERSTKEAHYAAKLLGGQKFIDFLNATGLGNNEMFIRIFSKIGRDYREDGTITGDMLNTKNKAELEAEIESIKKDKKDGYNNLRAGDHQARVDYVANLHAQIAEIEGDESEG